MDLVRNINHTKSKKVRNRFIKVSVLMLTACIVLTATYYYIKKTNRTNNEFVHQTALVRRGDLKITISGSGTLSSASTLAVASDIEGSIKKIYFKDGDWVKAGDLIMEIDNSEALLDIKKQQNNIAKGELSRTKLLESLEDSEITAPISGEVSDIKIKNEDNLGQGTALLSITDKSSFKLLLPFKNSYRNQIEINQKANIYVFNSELNEIYCFNGNVTYISQSPDDEQQEQLYNIEFTFQNTGDIDDSMMGSAEIIVNGKTLKSHEASKLSYSDTVTLKSDIAGIINEFNLIAGQYVNKGELLAKITNDDDKSIDLETSRLSLEEINNQLEYSMNRLAKYKIFSSIDGTLNLEEIKEGNTVKSGQTVFKVVNYNLMEFQIPIDELDIAKIEEGQSVSVTVDALPETTTNPLSGTVCHIAFEGTSNSGVAVYPVTIKLNEADSRLKVGMNANGEITIDEKENALFVPIEAVQKRGNTNIVYVLAKEDDEVFQNNNVGNRTETRRDRKDEENNELNKNQGHDRKKNTDEKQNINIEESRREEAIDPAETIQGGYYDGTVIKRVEVGINNEENIEILNGLKERD
ncbi:MAG: HlyD family efflux transporter periplasmic adaptor subunit, partial [Firmicutes bacterium]|nr:HlyD family efflux transporter periplasmic adaptor subunit [Bacillota bacterium]